jgi:hypothetical protein
LRKYFPYEDDFEDYNKKSIKILGKLLPGLERRRDTHAQKFSFNDLIIDIQKKGFTIEDSIDAVNNTLARLKMDYMKKSPYPDIEYSDYIKQVEDEILAHIVQGDEFKNIGKIGEFLYLGNEDELLGDGAYDKDNVMRDYLKRMNDIIKDTKFIEKNHNEDFNTAKAINSSIYLLNKLRKETNLRRAALVANTSGDKGIAMSVAINTISSELKNVFDDNLTVFFEPLPDPPKQSDIKLNSALIIFATKVFAAGPRTCVTFD